MTDARRHPGKPTVPRRSATAALVLVVAVLGLTSCDRDHTGSGSLSPGTHQLTGSFNDISSPENEPPPTSPWEASIDIGPEQWCLTDLSVDGVKLSMLDDTACATIATEMPKSIQVGTSDRGTVFAIYAPGRVASGTNTGPESPDHTAHSLSVSQAGPLILVLDDGFSDGAIQLVDSQRRSIDVPFSK